MDERIPDSKAPAIARGAAILRLLARSDEPLPLQRIARELGLVPSTCLHVLRALVTEELATVDGSKRYALGPGLLTFANAWLRRDRFAQGAQPEIERLAARFDVTAMGVAITGLDHIIVVATAQGAQNLQLSAQVGSRFPALLSATGRCIAAFGNHEPAELERRFRRLRWDNPPSYGDWMAQVAATRDHGYAVDDGNYIAGVTVIAAPAWRAPGPPTHALVALGLENSMRRVGIEDVGRATAQAAQAVSGQLGGL
ncbi:IclR family transcriptional regulator [Sphingomonas tabacisoli]|uniref:IclR family transcriptional regulator n=1 Tax=Sphingomonas tabacisoli TaxID=2249466 RepID=A0ABW4I5N1_9SPHN